MSRDATVLIFNSNWTHSPTISSTGKDVSCDAPAASPQTRNTHAILSPGMGGEKDGTWEIIAFDSEGEG